MIDNAELIALELTDTKHHCVDDVCSRIKGSTHFCCRICAGGKKLQKHKKEQPNYK